MLIDQSNGKRNPSTDPWILLFQNICSSVGSKHMLGMYINQINNLSSTWQTCSAHCFRAWAWSLPLLMQHKGVMIKFCSNYHYSQNVRSSYTSACTKYFSWEFQIFHHFRGEWIDIAISQTITERDTTWMLCNCVLVVW